MVFVDGSSNGIEVACSEACERMRVTFMLARKSFGGQVFAVVE
jgi:hypothetical protein